MLEYTMYYLCFGTIFSMVVDIATWYARKRGVLIPKSAEWDWNTRTIAILIWPIGIIYFIVGFIVEVTRKNNKK